MFLQEKLYWIGIRESEIIDTGNLFDGSITIFGSNKGNNYSYESRYHVRINYNFVNENLSDFINKTAKKIIQKFPDCKFLLYYPMESVEYDSLVYKHIICLNSSRITDLLENKIYSKLWLSKIVPIIPFSTMVGSELNYIDLCNAFPDENSFVIQGTFSCGGSGTWLISNEKDLLNISNNLNIDDLFTVTPYKNKSLSVNIHLMIYEHEILLFPASIQIICKKQHNLCYSGADFSMINQLPEDTIKRINKYATLIGNQLRIVGYKGICGIDFLVTLDEVYFMEVNSRFQSSSFLINDALKSFSLPSLQELNIDAFYHKTPSFQIPELIISKSFYSYSFCKDTRDQMRYVWEKARECPEVDCLIDDNLDWNISMESDTYLFKVVFNTNIACVSPEHTCRLYNGFDFEFRLFDDIPWHQQLKRFKVLILNQGIRINKNALAQLLKIGGPNYEEFYALDICVDDKLFINVPYKVAFSELSPFEIKYDKNEYWLNYYNIPIAKISVRTVDPFAKKTTQNNILYDEISYLGIDRLRIHQRNGCYFKDNNIGCQFCDISQLAQDYHFDDIKEVIQTYKNHPNISHYLVGGGSQNPFNDFSETIKIIEYIYKETSKNIYLMSIPPKETKTLKKLKESGVTEVAFNIEVFNRDLAKTYMPGKGGIPIERYENAFKVATKLWGKTGNVRSALIVGLEPKTSLIDGIEYLCKLGVSPILQIFKPANELEYFMAPSSQEILDIWEQAESMCRKYNIQLGPSCHYCEDNALKVTFE